MDRERWYHIWWYGLPFPDAIPFTSLKKAKDELEMQLDAAADVGDYPAAQLVSTVKGWPFFRIDYTDCGKRRFGIK